MKSKSASTAAADHQLHQLHQLQHHNHHHQNLFTSGGGQLLSPVGSSSQQQQQQQLNLGNGALTAAQILNYAAQLTGNGKSGPLDPSSSNSWDPAVALQMSSALQNSDCSNAAALAQLNAASQLIAASLLQQQQQQQVQANSLQESTIR